MKTTFLSIVLHKKFLRKNIIRGKFLNYKYTCGISFLILTMQCHNLFIWFIFQPFDFMTPSLASVHEDEMVDLDGSYTQVRHMIFIALCSVCSNDDGVFRCKFRTYIKLMKQRKSLGFNQYSRGSMCLAQGHNTVTLVGIEPRTSRFGVRHSTTRPILAYFS